MGLGILTAYWFNMLAISEGLGINLADLVELQGGRAVHLDRILTGIAIGGGAKTIKAIAKNFQSTRKELQKQLS